MLNIDWLIVAGADAVVADVGGHAIFEIKVSCDVFVLKETLTYHFPSDSPYLHQISWTDLVFNMETMTWEEKSTYEPAWLAIFYYSSPEKGIFAVARERAEE